LVCFAAMCLLAILPVGLAARPIVVIPWLPWLVAVRAVPEKWGRVRFAAGTRRPNTETKRRGELARRFVVAGDWRRPRDQT
jgi:hypothetical protein